MARLETQSLHQYDNARRLRDFDMNDQYRGLLKHHVTELIKQLNYDIVEMAEELEEETGGGVGKGLCHHVGAVLITAELQRELDRLLASQAAWAIHQGDSKGSVAKAMHKNPSNLYNRSNIGIDIARLLKLYDEAERRLQEKGKGTDWFIATPLNDGYQFTIHPTGLRWEDNHKDTEKEEGDDTRN
ncbi:hypothetical protein GA0061078_0006 [Bifidobacterium bohemicum]|uniref:Uncharacterized protein n=1 Tax=Bifidobacterium bohemicum DSM 22767 TaxID=1437606 RepID=A0A086ZDZ5_9BIFI|nr:hypothetical protein [Bifidobacterium bohemicum]KFI44745.1 hypothetical protein BBOH_1470 [Bifidobacterium bohemicum DSM 22767]SCC17516.1 hypothetical protein GA0061078_0006 [Bifidobacterium bohemicum]